MPAYAVKRYLQLEKPDGQDFLADRERLLRALAPDEAHISLDVLKTLYPLMADADYRITVTLCPGERGLDVVRVEPGDTRSRLFGLALDVGTTTLGMELVDLNAKRTLAEAGCTNSQTALGANILDRIFAVKADRQNLEALQRLVLDDVRMLIDRCCTEARVAPEEIAAMIVAGNTTMMHFFCGCDPWQVFQSPYAPAFFDPGTLRASELRLPLVCNMRCMPAIANYVGGDITSGLLLTDIDSRDSLAMFLDIGTNGELALGCRDFLLVGAGAAGPALEGAVSRSGMRAESGAVSRVQIDRDGSIRTSVIGGGAPQGICGSGIVDLIAEGLRIGWINANGTLNPEVSPCIETIAEADSARLQPAIRYADGPNGPLYFAQSDIREFIKCKAAANTMVATLLDACGLTAADVGTMYLSGGFGTHYDLESAIAIGLYPNLPREKFCILGNSSLAGAHLLLTDASCEARLRRIREYASYVQFGEMDRFLENMVAAQFLAKL